jgi:serine/threonine protein kinase
MPIIANKYYIDTILSNGSYGTVYKGYHIKNKKELVAIKKEIDSKSLKHEVKILNYLYSNKIRKIPAIYWYGNDNECTYLIMTMFDYPLSEYLKKKVLDTSKINGIMWKMIDIISQIHEKYVLHRDLKPSNFMIKNGELFLIDFGLSTFYVTDGFIHLPNDVCNTLIGSPKFISINIFDGNTYSRRDDLISLGYIYVMMVLNDTPWEIKKNNFIETEYSEINIHHPMNEIRRQNKILDVFLERYCLKMNENIIQYFKYIYGLEYDEKPKYNHILELFI